MAYLYSAVVWVIRLLLRPLSLVIPSISRYRNDRKNWSAEVNLIRQNAADRAILWFHCASLGEFEMAVPLMNIFSKREGYAIVVSFFSPSGFMARHNHHLIQGAFYLPADGRRDMRELTKILRPSAFFLVKYDFYYHLLGALQNAGIPCYLINGLMRRDHYLMRFWAGWFRKRLRVFRYVFVQTEEAAALFRQMGLDGIQVSGDLRYDRVSMEIPGKLERIEAFKRGRFMLVAGSSWPAEEALLAEYLAEAPDSLCLVLVPHDVSATHVGEVSRRFERFGLSRWSESGQDKGRVLLVDALGLLRKVYASADMAFIGGAFTGRVHNVLEACVVGMPILTGPKTDRFPEIQALEECGVLHKVTQVQDIRRFVQQYIDDRVAWEAACSVSRKHVEQKRGAVQVIAERLQDECSGLNPIPGK